MLLFLYSEWVFTENFLEMVIEPSPTKHRRHKTNAKTKQCKCQRHINAFRAPSEDRVDARRSHKIIFYYFILDSHAFVWLRSLPSAWVFNLYLGIPRIFHCLKTINIILFSSLFPFAFRWRAAKCRLFRILSKRDFCRGTLRDSPEWMKFQCSEAREWHFDCVYWAVGAVQLNFQFVLRENGGRYTRSQTFIFNDFHRNSTYWNWFRNPDKFKKNESIRFEWQILSYRPLRMPLCHKNVYFNFISGRSLCENVSPKIGHLVFCLCGAQPA